MDKLTKQQRYQRDYHIRRKENAGKPLLEGKARMSEHARFCFNVSSEWYDEISSYIKEVLAQKELKRDIRINRQSLLRGALNLTSCLPDQLQRDLAIEQNEELGEKIPSNELCHKIGAYLSGK